MKELILDGRFLEQPLTGVQRFAVEILKEFAKIDDLHVIVAMPSNAKPMPLEAKNIEFVRVGSRGGTLWEQFDLPKFCRKKKLPLLCTGNTAPFFYRSNVVLHDVLWLDMKTYAPKRSWTFKSRVMIRSFVYRSKNLFTVSAFSSDRIKQNFRKIKKAPVVLYNGYEHIFDWREERMENLPKSFYLAVGSVYPHKNFKYILHLAKNNPDVNFVIAGKKNTDYEAFLEQNHITNCFFTGYVSDGQLFWLYKNCEGFLLPSLYEGFGIPPLEAVACGCRKIILSDIPVFHEIYGDCATYFDPLNYDNTVTLSTQEISETAAEALLESYRWKNAAEIIIKTIFYECEHEE